MISRRLTIHLFCIHMCLKLSLQLFSFILNLSKNFLTAKTEQCESHTYQISLISRGSTLVHVTPWYFPGYQFRAVWFLSFEYWVVREGWLPWALACRPPQPGPWALAAHLLFNLPRCRVDLLYLALVGRGRRFTMAVTRVSASSALRWASIARSAASVAFSPNPSAMQ